MIPSRERFFYVLLISAAVTIKIENISEPLKETFLDPKRVL
jgi:hypothetical protein